MKSGYQREFPLVLNLILPLGSRFIDFSLLRISKSSPCWSKTSLPHQPFCIKKNFITYNDHYFFFMDGYSSSNPAEDGHSARGSPRKHRASCNSRVWTREPPDVLVFPVSSSISRANACQQWFGKMAVKYEKLCVRRGLSLGTCLGENTFAKTGLCWSRIFKEG